MGSRRILGFALGAHHDAGLAYGALAMAVAVWGGSVPGVVFHTDQGSEYTARSFRQACQRLGIAQSMGRPGSALDNTVIESWHSTLEFELRSLRKFATKAQARSAVAAWIEDYNHVRGTPLSACAARWITSGHWRERTPRDRGGPAARAGKRRRLRRRWPRSPQPKSPRLEGNPAAPKQAKGAGRGPCRRWPCSAGLG
jgi:hypothetical protein